LLHSREKAQKAQKHCNSEQDYRLQVFLTDLGHENMDSAVVIGQVHELVEGLPGGNGHAAVSAQFWPGREQAGAGQPEWQYLRRLTSAATSP
jgi:hypothetical protein